MVQCCCLSTRIYVILYLKRIIRGTKLGPLSSWSFSYVDILINMQIFTLKLPVQKKELDSRLIPSFQNTMVGINTLKTNTKIPYAARRRKARQPNIIHPSIHPTRKQGQRGSQTGFASWNYAQSPCLGTRCTKGEGESGGRDMALELYLYLFINIFISVQWNEGRRRRRRLGSIVRWSFSVHPRPPSSRTSTLRPSVADNCITVYLHRIRQPPAACRSSIARQQSKHQPQ